MRYYWMVNALQGGGYLTVDSTWKLGWNITAYGKGSNYLGSYSDPFYALAVF